MVLYGLKWIEAKNQESKTINDKSAGGYLVLTPIYKDLVNRERSMDGVIDLCDHINISYHLTNLTPFYLSDMSQDIV